jgi:hypothetical protein
LDLSSHFMGGGLTTGGQRAGASLPGAGGASGRRVTVRCTGMLGRARFLGSLGLVARER